MATFRFSRLARVDLLEIESHSLHKWGVKQAIKYNGDLEQCCQMLADNPRLGRECSEIRPGLRRLEHQSHIIFYRAEYGGILISRVLHKRMSPSKKRLPQH